MALGSALAVLLEKIFKMAAVGKNTGEADHFLISHTHIWPAVLTSDSPCVLLNITNLFIYRVTLMLDGNDCRSCVTDSQI